MLRAEFRIRNNLTFNTPLTLVLSIGVGLITGIFGLDDRWAI